MRTRPGAFGPNSAHATISGVETVSYTHLLTTEPPTIPRAMEHVTPQREKLPNDGAIYFYQPRWPAVAGRGESPVLRQPAVLATVIQRAKRVPWHKVRWNVALAAVVTVFAIALWVAYSGRGPASPLGSPALERDVYKRQ